MEKIWNEMYEAARAVLNAREISEYLTCGEQEIEKVLCILPDGSCGAPCGACRELMVQLMAGKYYDVEIMLDCSRGKTVRLGEITPEWWIK